MTTSLIRTYEIPLGGALRAYMIGRAPATQPFRGGTLSLALDTASLYYICQGGVKVWERRTAFSTDCCDLHCRNLSRGDIEEALWKCGEVRVACRAKRRFVVAQRKVQYTLRSAFAHGLNLHESYWYQSMATTRTRELQICSGTDLESTLKRIYLPYQYIMKTASAESLINIKSHVVL